MSLWSHQREAIEWLKARKAGILHHGMGCGKTRSLLEFLVSLRGCNRALVCCPKAVMPAWVKQVGLWCPQYRVAMLDQSTKARKVKSLTAALSDTSPLIVVVNYDSAWRIDEIEKARWDALVWDEVHRLKSPSGKASRWAARMATKNPDARKVGLTGTLIPHSVLDLFAIYRAVESPVCETFGRSFVEHRLHYAVMNPHQPGMVVSWRNLAEAHRKVAQTTHHAKSSDVLDLPPIQLIDRPVALSAAESRLYSAVETEFIAVAESGTVTVANALVQLLRLQQIAGGYVRLDGEERATKIVEHPAKSNALRDMLDDLPVSEPLVVFCRFSSDIACVTEVCKATGRQIGELSGRRNDLADWQSGKTTVLVTQIQSGGIGIDLTRASYCIFYSLGYSLAEYEQAVARLHRPGQDRRTLVYHLIAESCGKSTVDGRVYEALRERKEVVNAIIDGYRTPVGAR